MDVNGTDTKQSISFPPNGENVSTKVITYQDGMLHILRNPHGFPDEVVREAHIAAGDHIEDLGRRLAAMTDAYENMRAWAQENGLDTASYCGPKPDSARVGPCQSPPARVRAWLVHFDDPDRRSELIEDQATAFKRFAGAGSGVHLFALQASAYSSSALVGPDELGGSFKTSPSRRREGDTAIPQVPQPSSANGEDGSSVPQLHNIRRLPDCASEVALLPVGGKQYTTITEIYESIVATGLNLRGMRGTIEGALADAYELGMRRQAIEEERCRRAKAR